MLCKIRVDCNAILSYTKVYPVRLNINLSLPFLQKQDICCHFGSCIIFKCSIRKSYCSHKLCSFSQILSDSRICLIKCSLCGNHRNHASQSYLIKCFCQKIIVDTEVILVVLRIKNLIITKWHISDNYIKEVIRICCILKSCDTDIGILIKLLCNSSRNAVKLHPIQLTSLHRCRHTPKEVTDTHRWF